MHRRRAAVEATQVALHQRHQRRRHRRRRAVADEHGCERDRRGVMIDEAQVDEDERNRRCQLLGLHQRQPIAQAGHTDVQRHDAGPQRDAQAGETERDGHRS